MAVSDLYLAYFGSKNSGDVTPSLPTDYRIHIDNFNNYSSEDIESLTEQVLSTANAFITRKRMAY